MSYGLFSCNYFISVNNFMSTSKVYDEQKSNEQIPSMITEHQRSFLVTLSARVLGSAGLGLSILAIWIRWFVPSSPVVLEVKANKPQARHRRRSTPTPSNSPIILPLVRRTTMPPLPSVLRHSQESPSNRHKRVYFLDSKLPTIKSQQILTSVVSPDIKVEDLDQLILQSTSLQSQPEDDSPLPSITAPTNAVDGETTFHNPEAREESIAESDCSSRRSSVSIRLPKMNTFLAKGRRGSSTSDSTINSPVPVLSSSGSGSAKKSSMGLTAPWSITKARPTTAETLPETSQIKSSSPSRLSFRRLSGCKQVENLVELPLPSPSPENTPIPSSSPLAAYFSRKPQRRSSTPVPLPRTSPYEAPYFAAPPIPSDASYSAYLRALPRFGDDMNSKVPRNQTQESELSRGRRSRQTDTEAQAVLGQGRPRLLPKRRSASEGGISAHSRRV